MIREAEEIYICVTVSGHGQSSPQGRWTISSKKKQKTTQYINFKRNMVDRDFLIKYSESHLKYSSFYFHLIYNIYNVI